MSRPRRLAVLALVPLALGTVAAYAPQPLPANCRIIDQGTSAPGDELEVCEVRTYFHCPASTRTPNVGLSPTPSPFDTNRPAGSVLAGRGCGALDVTGSSNNSVYGFQESVFTGTFRGRLDALTVEMHARNFAKPPSAAEMATAVRLRIDGAEVVPHTHLNATRISGSSNEVTAAFEFSIRDIGLTRKGDDGNHDVELTLYTTDFFSASLMAWDATEVPSGITFNPKVLAPVRVTAG